jgi:hypothetical protein
MMTRSLSDFRRQRGAFLLGRAAARRSKQRERRAIEDDAFVEVERVEPVPTDEQAIEADS